MRRAIYKGINLKTPVEIMTKVSGFNVLGKNGVTQIVNDDGQKMSFEGNNMGQVGLHTFVDDVITIVMQSETEADAYTALMCLLQGIERLDEKTHGGGLVFEEVD